MSNNTNPKQFYYLNNSNIHNNQNFYNNQNIYPSMSFYKFLGKDVLNPFGVYSSFYKKNYNYLYNKPAIIDYDEYKSNPTQKFFYKT